MDEATYKRNSSHLLEIILSDITSRKILQQEFANSVTLTTEQLEGGIYLYEVKKQEPCYRKGEIGERMR